jgi:uncharacterized protein
MNPFIWSVCLSSAMALASVTNSPVKSNSDAAADYKVLAAKGNSHAQAVLGELALQQGDTGAAFEWLSKAAESGETVAQVRLADLYVEGRGTIRNASEAAHWYALAVGNSPEAQWKLGRLFEAGDGVSKSDDIAAAMYSRAAEQDFAQAQNSLADLYVAGRGVKQNFKAAFDLYQKAALQSNAEAELNLGALYYYGIGTAPDYEAARTWLLKARTVLHKEADELLVKIDKASRPKP